MADLILSKKEIQAPFYLDWDDASLGKAVRALMANIGGQYKDPINREISQLGVSSAYFLLVSLAVNSNLGTLSLESKDVEVSKDGVNKKVGKWRLELKQLEVGELEDQINSEVEKTLGKDEPRITKLEFELESQ